MLHDHLEKIPYFRRVCEAGTFRQAAAELRMSQSSLTVAVKKLEECIGAALLVRSKRGVRATPQGEALLAFARDLDLRIQGFDARLRAPADAVSGVLRLGAYDSIAIYWLPGVLRRLKRTFPYLTVSISIGSSASLAQRVRQGDLDLAVVVHSPGYLDLMVDELFGDAFGLYGTREVVQEHDETTEVIGMFAAQAGQGSTLGEVLRVAGWRARGGVDVGSFEVAKALALQGLGLAALPHRVAGFAAGRTLLRVPGPLRDFAPHQIGLAASAAGADAWRRVRDQIVALARGRRLSEKSGAE